MKRALMNGVTVEYRDDDGAVRWEKARVIAF